MKRPKVFGIGFHKTGTKSLAEALKVLGYRVTGSFGVNDPDIGRTAVERGLRIADKFDAVQDNPWPLLYRELDERFPGSRFILTLRPTASWLASCVRHFGALDTPMRKWIYGVGHPLGHEQLYVDRYERHEREVREYFRDRPGELLTLRLTEGEEWNKLCPFLGHEVPARPFPHANAGRTESPAPRRGGARRGGRRKRSGPG
jgi:hypothetical protein